VPPAPPAAVGEDAREVLFVGSLSYDPNIEAVDWLLTDVWPRVRAAAPGTTLRVVGRNPSPALRRRCRDADGVELVADAPSLVAYYHAARAVIVPLRTGGGTGRIKVLEAMAYGVPIVATTQAVDGVAVADGRDVLLAEDAEGLARHAAELLGDAARARLLGQAGRAVWARDHAPEAATGIIGAVVERVLRAPLTPR
jgi:glycosyltransferase involved in cell wall biosynthesis